LLVEARAVVGTVEEGKMGVVATREEAVRAAGATEEAAKEGAERAAAERAAAETEEAARREAMEVVEVTTGAAAAAASAGPSRSSSDRLCRSWSAGTCRSSSLPGRTSTCRWARPRAIS